MDFYISIVEFLGLLIATISTVFIFSKKIREYIINWYTKRQEFQKARREIPNILKQISDRLYRVESELRPNGGGSIKDAINIIKAEMDANNWLTPRPTFRCTSKGVNVFVNEAYCHLCGVTSDELMKLGWKGFAYDDDQADDYYERFIQSTDNHSQFSGKLKLKTKNDEYRGEWIVRIRPLGPIVTPSGNDFLWHGGLWPSDQVAKDYARTYNIPLI